MTKPTTRQLRLPAAPVLDWTGLHARSCECSSCELGYGPSESQRERAAAEARAKHAEKALQAAAEAQLVTREKTAVATRVRSLRKQEEVERKLKEFEAARLNAAPPPAGGFREWLKNKG